MNRFPALFHLDDNHRENSGPKQTSRDGERDNESYLETRYILLTARYGSVHSHVVARIDTGVWASPDLPLPLSTSVAVLIRQLIVPRQITATPRRVSTSTDVKNKRGPGRMSAKSNWESFR